MERSTEMVRIPDQVSVITNGENALKGEGTYEKDDIRITIVLEKEELLVSLCAVSTPVKEIILGWKEEEIGDGLFLGDHWERSYGDLEWKEKKDSGIMPWYFLKDCEGGCFAYGVKVRPGAMCWWEVQDDMVCLHLDVRCGSAGVVLSGRNLPVARVLMKCYKEDAFSAGQSFCHAMCEEPLKVDVPVYGSNNWYYAYGVSSREQILRDTDYLASLTEGIVNRPFMVIDDGWQSAHSAQYNGGPWRAGNRDYGDMRQLAADMKKSGVRPGIWFRPLYDISGDIPEKWRLSRESSVLDISVAEVIDHVQEDMRRIAGWGFELVKHDFSTFDIFGFWGKDMGSHLTEGDWQFADNSRTTAEIIIAFYQAILEAAEGMLILGCNCIGHLGAGLMHINRIGDDTSGMEWERTKTMGINTLAFRMPQQGAFFEIDADCVGITENVPWEKNKQWMELLSESGTPFFASVKPGILNRQQEEELRRAYQKASVNREAAIPMDWKDIKTPAKWQTFEGVRTFSW